MGDEPFAARPLGDRVYEISDLVEKPRAEEAPSDLAIIGRYVLTPDLFALLAEIAPDRRGEIQLTDALRRLRERRPMYALEFEGKRYDTATSSASSRPPWSSRGPAPTSPTSSAPI